MAAAWLIALAAMLLAFAQARQDRVQYARFKILQRSAERQTAYRRWLFEAFCRYGVLGMGGLILLRRADALWRMPADFRRAVDAEFSRAGFDPSTVASIGAGITGGLLAGTLIACVLPLVSRRVRPPLIGDVSALLPRNAAEGRWCAALALHAGLSEELYFRLLLPLAGWLISGEAAGAMLAACVLFGLAHAYQGPAGIGAALVMGLLLAGAYLATRQLWVAMLLHIMLDVRVLLVMPWANHRQR